jgi:predicted dehydrogenase
MTLRWGILGAAKFAREHMGPAIHAAKGAELVALATSDPAKAAPFLEFAPKIWVHDSYDALLRTWMRFMYRCRIIYMLNGH